MAPLKTSAMLLTVTGRRCHHVAASAQMTWASDSFMDPQGPIAAIQRTHLLRATVLILLAVVPVLVLVPLIALRYRRRKGGEAAYKPKVGLLGQDWNL